MSTLTSATVAPWADDHGTQTRLIPTYRRRRRRFLTASKEQLRLFGEALVLIAVSAVAVFDTYHAYSILVTGLGEPLSGFSATSQLMVWAYVSMVGLISTALVVVVGIYYSHRVMGPATKITRVLAEMAEGELPANVRLRKRDHLKGVASALNCTGQAWNDALADIRRSVDRLKTSDSQQVDLRAELAAIEAVLDKYRLSART